MDGMCYTRMITFVIFKTHLFSCMRNVTPVCELICEDVTVLIVDTRSYQYERSVTILMSTTEERVFCGTAFENRGMFSLRYCHFQRGVK